MIGCRGETEREGEGWRVEGVGGSGQGEWRERKGDGGGRGGGRGGRWVSLELKGDRRGW